jgi:hypothetical protein
MILIKRSSAGTTSGKYLLKRQFQHFYIRKRKKLLRNNSLITIKLSSKNLKRPFSVNSLWKAVGYKGVNVKFTLNTSLWRACNLTAFTPCLTGPVDYPFASVMRDPDSNPQGDTYVKPVFS